MGLLLCALLLSIEEASGRVAAEILPFCEALLYSATKKAVPVDSYDSLLSMLFEYAWCSRGKFFSLACFGIFV